MAALVGLRRLPPSRRTARASVDQADRPRDTTSRTPELRGDLAVWRAAVGVKPDDRTVAGPPLTDDREATYHRHLIRTVNDRYGEALKVWETRILDYVGHRDEHTINLARQLDQLQRRGVDAEQVLDFAAARKPLPIDHATSALAYRVRELVTRKRNRRSTASIEPVERRPQQPSGPSLGL